jgi:hypothetical protein
MEPMDIKSLSSADTGEWQMTSERFIRPITRSPD